MNVLSFMLFDIGNNKITGMIPEILGNLRKLDTLFLGALFLEYAFSHAKTEF